jgi:hypothetical protein
MKKIFLIIALAFTVMFASLAHAQINWHTANQGTFQWDAVVADGGNPAGTHVEYRVSIIDSITDVATVDGSGEVLKESEFARSNLPEYCLNGETFGFQMWPGLSAPTGMNEGGG